MDKRDELLEKHEVYLKVAEALQEIEDDELAEVAYRKAAEIEWQLSADDSALD